MPANLSAPWLAGTAITTVQQILQSHRQAFGRELIAPPPADASPLLAAQELFAATPAVLAHDGAPLDIGEGPRLIYANRTALSLWRRRWSAMVGMPSRLTAEPQERTSRQQALAGGEVEVAFGFLAAMTFDTVLVQQAADLLEQGEATGHPLGVVGRQRRRPSRKDP